MITISVYVHACVQVKLQLEEADKTPVWVTELLQSGKLMEVHKVMYAHISACRHFQACLLIYVWVFFRL
jgi:hypothetical protein